MLGWSLFFSGIEATTASVVKNIAATLAACCNAERVTLVGSTIPASNILTHSFVAALNPTPGSAFFKRSTMTEPSNPAFSAIWRTGAVNALSTIFTPVSMSPSASISLTFW